MRIILLSPYDLAAAALVLILAIISLPLRLNLFKQIVIAALRTIVQLLLVGIVLKAVFESVSLLWIGAMGLVMLGVAARETTRRQKRRLAGGWAFYIGGFSMLVGSFSVTILALTVILNVKPWYQPQYAIPLLGMMLGNTMTGVALGLDRLTQESWQQREEIEACLMLGYSWDRAIADIRRDSIRAVRAKRSKQKQVVVWKQRAAGKAALCFFYG